MNLKGNAMSQTSINSSCAGQHQAAQAPSLTQSQLAAQAASQFNAAYNNYPGQSYQQQSTQYSQAQMQSMAAGLAQHKQQYWMVNGRTMNFNQFLDEICPDPEDSMRTFLSLKYKGMK
jgi:hypothetical protein